MKLIPKNWGKFQHYKDRSPPWIKLHREILDDREFMLLPIASKALAPLLWLLASESKDGSFDASEEELIFRLRVTSKDLAGLKPLIDKGFFVVASDALAGCQQDARPEGEGEGETEVNILREVVNRFSDFWEIYPKKKSKGDAEKAWKAIKPNEQLVAAILNAVEVAKTSEQWLSDDGKYIPYPASWLRAKGWEDDVESSRVKVDA